jgi:hypothetical protein
MNIRGWLFLLAFAILADEADARPRACNFDYIQGRAHEWCEENLKDLSISFGSCLIFYRATHFPECFKDKNGKWRL